MIRADLYKLFVGLLIELWRTYTDQLNFKAFYLMDIKGFIKSNFSL